MKFVHALNVAVVYIGMEKFGNAQTVTTQRKTKEEKRLLITGYIPVVRRILSVPQIPITSDYRMARAFARRIDPSLVSVQGTAIGKALEQALLEKQPRQMKS